MTKILPTEKFTNINEECDALRMKIFSIVSHDLRTPLACIIGSLGTLDQMSANLSPEQRDILIKTALAEAQKLSVIIAQMLDKAKP